MPDENAGFLEEVDKQARRKLAAQRERTPIVGLGLGMLGAVGWSVGLPTVVGAMLGAAWDRHQPGVHSRTLMLLAAGLVLGCANAWRWISQANAATPREPADADE